MSSRGNDPGDGSGPWLPPIGRPDDNEPYEPPDEPADPPDYGEDERPPYDGAPYEGPVGPDLGRMPGAPAELSPLALFAGVLVVAHVATAAFDTVRAALRARAERKAHRALLAGALPSFDEYRRGKRPVTRR